MTWTLLVVWIGLQGNLLEPLLVQPGFRTREDCAARAAQHVNPDFPPRGIVVVCVQVRSRAT